MFAGVAFSASVKEASRWFSRLKMFLCITLCSCVVLHADGWGPRSQHQETNANGRQKGGALYDTETPHSGPALMALCEDDDSDGDGLCDRLEDSIARYFAPTLQLDPDEQYYPTNVDAFLSLTSLWYYDDDCTPDLHEQVGEVTQKELVSLQHGPTCNGSQSLSSHGTRSRRKQNTYYLADLPASARSGLKDPSNWEVYVHSYPNSIGGITLQYWLLYVYNSLVIEHGGDWEASHIVLGPTGRPVLIRLLGHNGIDSFPPGALQWTVNAEGEHPTVFVLRGGHTGSRSGRPGGLQFETWRMGRLVNIGEKTQPRNGQQFVQYSGLWGSPGTFYQTGGYWGPAYNETSLDIGTGYITAWCLGILDGERQAPPQRECYPMNESR